MIWRLLRNKDGTVRGSIAPLAFSVVVAAGIIIQKWHPTNWWVVAALVAIAGIAHWSERQFDR